MVQWEERVVRETRPSIRVEHDLRYRVAAGLIRSSALWADLGCGTGVPAASALEGGFTGRAVLVDIEEDVVAIAAQELGIADTQTVVADLSSADDVQRVSRALLDAAPPGARTVTCFETLEHLATFVPLTEALIGLARDDRCTVLLSVPNDAFWSIENPYHQSMWGEGAFEELRRLLPADTVVMRQVPLCGSAVVADSPGGGDASLSLPEVSVQGDRVPSHLLAAFGPRASEVQAQALALPADLDEQRRWERQRESDNAVLQARVADVEAELAASVDT